MPLKERDEMEALKEEERSLKKKRRFEGNLCWVELNAQIFISKEGFRMIRTKILLKRVFEQILIGLKINKNRSDGGFVEDEKMRSNSVAFIRWDCSDQLMNKKLLYKDSKDPVAWFCFAINWIHLLDLLQAPPCLFWNLFTAWICRWDLRLIWYEVPYFIHIILGKLPLILLYNLEAVRHSFL